MPVRLGQQAAQRALQELRALVGGDADLAEGHGERGGRTVEGRKAGRLEG